MRKKTKIGFDLDNVLVDFANTFRIYINHKLKININLEDMSSWSWAYENEQIGREFDEILKDYNFMCSLPKLPDSYKLLEKLKINYELFVITKREAIIAEQTIKFIHNKFPMINKKNIIIAT